MPSALTVVALLWSPIAGAVTGGVQAAIFPHGLDYLSSVISGTEIDLYEPQVGAEYSCYDELGIQDFNLNIPVDNLQISIANNQINVRVDFGTIYGDDMVIYGLDEDWLDACPEFEGDLLYLSLTNSVFEISLLPKIVDGDLELEVLGEPSYTGNLDMDIDWVPDDLILYFMEETIFETIGDVSKTMTSELIAQYWSASLLSGQVYDFDVFLGLTETETTSRAISIGGDMDVQWVGEPTCSNENSDGADGRQPEMSFGTGDGASLGIGATEVQVNELFVGLWDDGYLCFDENRMELLWSAVEGLFDPNVAGVTASAVFLSPPIVTMNPDNSTVSLSGLEVQISGEVDGSNVELAFADLSATASLSLALDSAITSLTMTIHELNLEVNELRADHLLSNTDGATQDLVSFLEGWLSVWVASELDNVVLFTTQFHTFNTFIRVQDVDWGDGSLKAFIKLYDENDPAVDKIPPDTSVSLANISKTPNVATFDVTVSDDRDDPIAISWSLDEMTWSTWEVLDTIEIPGASVGVHSLLVKSRDSWLNEDASPASILFEIIPTVEDETKSCGCTTTSTRDSRGLIWSGIIALLATIRRRR